MNLGSDTFEMASVYRSKFDIGKSPLNNSSERIEIKNKMSVDSIALGQHGAKIDSQTTTQLSFRQYASPRNNSNRLPPSVDANIKATHFVLGPGGPSPPTEA